MRTMRGCLAALTAIAIAIAACGDDPTQLMGGRGPRRSASGTHGSPSRGSTEDVGDEEDGTSSPTNGRTSSSPATPATPSNPTTPTPTGTTAEEICVAEINRYRATLGLKALARWTSAEACSDGEAQSDGQTGHAHGAFGKCGEYAQNECPGWPGPDDEMISGCLEAMWNEGPGGGHHDNMASTKLTKVACGFYTMTNGDVWSVQNFR